ncbi:uncharacterized protein TNCV_4208821 [Trichonephila clavipes]|nr:uncharacterized protein TNCV_4208821 [Trichonephila clavipes]
MIARFEKTGHLGVQPDRGRKSTRSDVVEDVATAIHSVECTEKSGALFPVQNSSQSAVDGQRQGEATDLCIDISGRVEVDASWPWKILWSDEAHFHLSRTVNTHNCRIWDTENHRTFQEIPLYSPKVTVWCGFTATFILGPFFFEETTRNGPVICTGMARRWTPPHIGLCVQQFLRQHFINDRVISRAFPTAWTPRSPDLNPCDFWLWGYFKKSCLWRTSNNHGRFEGQYHSACEKHLCRPITINS